jgi:hypothetical protein
MSTEGDNQDRRYRDKNKALTRQEEIVIEVYANKGRSDNQTREEVIIKQGKE